MSDAAKLGEQGEELKKRLQQMLDAPKSEPITIDKGHGFPSFENAADSSSRREEMRTKREPRATES